MAEEIVFKTTVDTGNSVSAINNVDKSLKAVNNTIKEVSSTSKQMSSLEKQMSDINTKVESGTLDVKQLTRVIKEYQTVALNAGSNSPIGKEAIKKAGELRDKLADLNTQINHVANDGKNMQTALQVGQGVAAGYAVAQGAMALFGSENKDLQKTLVKLQAAQAVLNGLEQIRIVLNKDSLVMTKARFVLDKIKIAYSYSEVAANTAVTTSLRIQRVAWLALPIVMIIAGIVALAAAMGAFSDSTADAAEKQAALNQHQKRGLEIALQVISQSEKIRANQQGGVNMIQKEIDILKAKGATEQEVFLKEQELAAQKIQNLKIKGLSLDQNNKHERTEAWRTVFEIKQAEHEKLVLETANDKAIADAKKTSSDEAKKKRDERNKEHIQQERERLLNLKKLENDFLKEIEQAETEYYDSLLTQRQKDIQDVNDYYFNLISIAEQNGQDATVLRQAQAQKLYLINKEFTDKETEDRKNALDIQAQAEEDFYTTYQDAINTSAQNEITAINDKYFLLIKTAEQYGLDTIELEKKRQDELDKVEETAINKKIDNIKKIADATMTSLNALNDLQNQLDANKLKSQNLTEAQILEIKKKAFNRDKALKIASVSINTAEAISKSVAASPLTFGAPFSVFSAVTGIAQIAAIASTKFDGGGSNVTAPTTPSNDTQGGGGGFGSGSTSQVSSVGLTDNATGIKVTVVDSEIKAVMDASANASVLSTFGG